ncbi:MAG: PorV/PorQ family protein [Elusimicrobiales bacterium]|nr:PorV/PorQ family protein [Elusimicrobiales bacterium]
MNTRKHIKGGGAVTALFITAAILGVGVPASAGGPGSAGMQVLKSDMSPRAAGMGGAFVAVADDIYTMSYNPAGLGQLYIPEASAVLHQSGFDDSSMNNISFGLPLPFIGLGGLAKPGFGISLMLSDAGSFSYRQRIPNTAPAHIGEFNTTSKSYDAQKDVALTFGYGEKVYSGEVNLEGYNAKIEQYLGLNLKYLKSTMLEHYSATAFAFDGGWLMLEPNLGLSLGASISNYGSGLKYGTEQTKLPSILRVGASWEKPTVMDQSILLATEGDFYMAEGEKSLRFGLEYHFEKVFNLRLGYKAAEDNKGMTMGLGLHYNDMSLDFSSAMGNEVYNAKQLAFSYRFSGVTIGEYKKKMNFKDPETRKAGQDDAVKKPSVQEQKPARQERKPAKGAPEKKKDSDFFWIY